MVKESTNSSPSLSVTKARKTIFDLAKSFNNPEEIIADKNGKVRVLAEAMDMSYADCANLIIKLQQTDKLLRSPLKFTIDGEQVELKHPLTGKPLSIGDILVDRSGPKFSFPLEEGLGQQFLPSHGYSPKQEIIRSQKEKLLTKAEKAGLTVEELDAAVAIFQSHHPAQRKLSDFDLETREFGLLQKAISNAYHEKTGERIPANMEEEVVRIHWMFGGGISSEEIKLAHEKPGHYASMVKARFQQEEAQHKKHSHMLSDSAGLAHHEMHMHYGPSISFESPDAMALNMPGLQQEILLQRYTEKHRVGTAESCDAILDSFPDFMGLKDKFDIDTKYFNKLMALDGGEKCIRNALNSQKHSPFDFNKLAESVTESLPQHRPTIARITESFRDEIRFTNNMLLMQEIGRKMSLCEGQKDKESKLVGNISDVGPFLANLKTQAENDPEVKPLLQMAQLSYLVSLSRWGVNSENLSQIGDCTNAITPKTFATEMNKKSYQREGSHLRKSLGWCKISEETAKERLTEFHEGAESLTTFAKKHSEYFKQIETLRKATKEHNQKATFAAIQGIQTELKSIISAMPEMAKTLNLDKESTDKLISQLTQKTVEAVVFNERRSILQQQRETAKGQETGKTTSQLIGQLLEEDISHMGLPSPVIMKEASQKSQKKMR